MVYELLGIRDGDDELRPDAAQLQLCDLTAQAYAQFALGDWEQAEQAYAKVVQMFPQDPVGLRMLAKTRTKLGQA